jgi:hypothetical protein
VKYGECSITHNNNKIKKPLQVPKVCPLKIKKPLQLPKVCPLINHSWTHKCFLTKQFQCSHFTQHSCFSQGRESVRDPIPFFFVPNAFPQNAFLSSYLRLPIPRTHFNKTKRTIQAFIGKC